MMKPTDRFFLERVNYVTGERSGRVEVTGKSERQRDIIERGMLRNLHEDWHLATIREPAVSGDEVEARKILARIR